jgi:hypothetical protein
MAVPVAAHTAIAHPMCAWARRSKVIQNLPPVIFTLMKSTEPHSDVYYTFDVEVMSALLWFVSALQQLPTWWTSDSTPVVAGLHERAWLHGGEHTADRPTPSRGAGPQTGMTRPLHEQMIARVPDGSTCCGSDGVVAYCMV